MLKIVTAPQSILAQSAKPVAVRYLAKQISKIDKTVLELVGEMEKTLLAAKDPEGVGLAAPQVGRSLQIFIVKPTPKTPIQVFINPVIAQKKAELNAEQRGSKTQRSSASGSAKFRDSTKKLEG